MTAAVTVHSIETSPRTVRKRHCVDHRLLRQSLRTADNGSTGNDLATPPRHNASKGGAGRLTTSVHGVQIGIAELILPGCLGPVGFIGLVIARLPLIAEIAAVGPSYVYARGGTTHIDEAERGVFRFRACYAVGGYAGFGREIALELMTPLPPETNSSASSVSSTASLRSRV